MSDKIIAIAENGQPVTQAMVDKWCEEYDAGNYFPENEETTAVFWGVPNQTLSKTITFKVSEQLEHALKERADKLGVSTSDFCRNAISEALHS